MDLKLLKTCRDNAINMGVPAAQLPWNYGELDDGDGNVKDKNKEKGNDDKKKNDDEDDKKKAEKKKKKAALSKRITNLYSDLESLKEERAELDDDDEKGAPIGAPGNSNGKGNQHVTIDFNSQAMQQQNQNLKSQIVNQLQGAYRGLPAKDVS